MDKEIESHREQVNEPEKEYDKVVDEGIKGVLDAFQNACNQVEVLCPCIESLRRGKIIL